MPGPFLSSEEYDERAHMLYDRGEYDAALDTLKEGLTLYPHSVDLYVGLGYTRLAREEFVWAKQSFEKALVLDPEHEDGLVGLGEVLLRIGEQESALGLFKRVRAGAGGDDLDLLMTMGRALYRQQLFAEARRTFEAAVRLHPDSADAAAALGFTAHRLGDDAGAIRELRGALSLDGAHAEARIYLGHLLYDRAEWTAALDALEQVPPSEHWDTLALWRLIELKKSVGALHDGDPELVVWEARLTELEEDADPIDDLLAEIETGAGARPAIRARPSTAPVVRHRVRLPDGTAINGSWSEIVRQLRDREGRRGESLAQFMRRRASDTRARIGVVAPSHDPEAFILAYARAGLLQIES